MARIRKDEVWDGRKRISAGSLFERLVADEGATGSEREINELDASVRSVKRHLIRLLNARAGGSASAPDLGLVDFNVSSIESNDLTQHIAASIRKCIDTYEPRIQVRSVDCVKDPDRPLDLRFRIITMVPIERNSEQVQIDLLMRDGKFARIF
jgi:type VI secretion system protein